MSSVKNILAVVSDAESGRTSLATALHVARHLDAHVDALHIRPDPVAALPLIGEAMSGAMVDEMIAVAEREAAARAQKARGVYESMVTAGASTHWLEDSGAEEQIVALRACRADLIVLARPTQNSEAASLVTLNAALMQTGRAVIAAPPNAATTHAFPRVAIFWNGSAEATRAVTAALPFLVTAEQVFIFRVEEEEWFAPAEDLEAYLQYHKVKAMISKVLPKEGRTAKSLLAASHDAGADLMVMGAYTRSKLRQLILGSVTGYVMQHAMLPVLLCH